MGDGDIEGKSKIAVSGRECVYLEVFFGLESVDGGPLCSTCVQRPIVCEQQGAWIAMNHNSQRCMDCPINICMILCDRSKNTNNLDIDIIETNGLHQDKRQESQTNCEAKINENIKRT